MYTYVIITHLFLLPSITTVYMTYKYTKIAIKSNGAVLVVERLMFKILF